MSQFKTIEVVHQEGVDWLWLNRPDALNAITTEMVTELRAYFDSLMENSETRVVVMGGVGALFARGLISKPPVIPRMFGPLARGWGSKAI
ncbi:enoyl-CoA hydratase-related protein [Pseudomonadales bacterium]|nr:enoyl-CoA hydratase-related protein [Pseudomonadales bacterium]